MSLRDNMQAAAILEGIERAEQDPVSNIPRLLKRLEKDLPDDDHAAHRRIIRHAIREEDSAKELIRRFYDVDTDVRKTFLYHFIYNANQKGAALQSAASVQHHCQIPGLISIDLTCLCMIEEESCSRELSSFHLDFDAIDAIICQGKKLGIYMYAFHGSDPLLRKKELLLLGTLHSDCEFFVFTSGQLINEEFCEELLRVKNLIPILCLNQQESQHTSSLDADLERCMPTMKKLRMYRLLFGVSAVYTSMNWEEISSEAFFDSLIENGALFAQFYHYMPIGTYAEPALLPASWQREALCLRIRDLRKTKPLFTIDLQNDDACIGGCIAGGRRYIHINAKGDVEPCCFIRYSDRNIHTSSLIEALSSPLMQAFHRHYPFSNHALQTCPLLENPDQLYQIIKETQASNSEYFDHESIFHLCAKCSTYAAKWKETADHLINEMTVLPHKKPSSP